MNVIESIFTRRSIRKYTSDPVREADIETMLKSAMCAPSARNTQPWHFVVIKDRDILDKVPEFHPYAEMIKHAPLAIAVCGDSGIENNTEYLAVDCSAATENLLLAAHALGLGAVWLGIYPREKRMKELGDLLKLPESVMPVALIVIGHPAEEKSPEDRFDPAKIHREKW